MRRTPFLFTGLIFILNSGTISWAEFPRDEGIRCTISVSNQKVLPFESLRVMITLRNETGELKRVVAPWATFLFVGEGNAEGVTWKQYTPDQEPIQEPPAPSAISFKPGESKTWVAHLDYEHPGRHVFARPGKFKIKAHIGVFECDPVDVIVQDPQGIDAEAYEFLQKSDIHKFFSENTVRKYPYDRSTIQSLEKFIADFDGSQYSYFAQFGLGLLRMHGVK